MSKNKKIAVISSGYGSSVSSPTKVTNSSFPQKVGDEAVLIHSKINSIVVSGKNRVKSSMHCDQYDLDYIIHDDGLQHYSLNRNHQLIIINNKFKGNNFILPCGPYREPKFFHNKTIIFLATIEGNIYLDSIQKLLHLNHVTTNNLIVTKNFLTLYYLQLQMIQSLSMN